MIWINRPVIASTTTTDIHGMISEFKGYKKSRFKSSVHEAIRHFYRNIPKTKIRRLDYLMTYTKYFTKKASSLENEMKQHPHSNTLLSVHHKAGEMTKAISLLLVRLQIAAKLRNIRVYLGADWSEKEAKDCFNMAKNLCIEAKEDFVLIPSLDMDSLIIPQLYAYFKQEGYKVIAFISRAPKKHVKLNYAFVEDMTEDGIIKHISGVTWRTRADRDKARVILFWAMGFNSIALRSNPPTNQDRRGARSLWDIKLDFLKFFNPKSILIDRLRFFDRKQRCPCPVHKKRSITITSNELYDTEYDGALASCHDLHSMQIYLNKKYWQGKREALRTDARLLEIYTDFVGRRNHPATSKK